MTQFLETAQGIMATGALIGASGVAIGFLLPGIARLLKPRADIHERAEARNLAMLTLLALDDFVGASYAAIHDTPEFNPMDEGEFVFHVPEPMLSLPKDPNWRVFGTELSDRILWLSNRVKNLNHALDSLDLSAPGYGNFFERRQEGYAVLAAEAMDLIEQLLEEFDLTLPSKPDYYRQREGFVRTIQNAGDQASRRKKEVAAVQANGSNVLQLFPKAGEDAE